MQVNKTITFTRHRGHREIIFCLSGDTDKQKVSHHFGQLLAESRGSFWRIGISSSSQRLYEPVADSPKTLSFSVISVSQTSPAFGGTSGR